MTTRTPHFRPELTAEVFNGRSRGHLPGLLGVEIVRISAEAVESRLPEGASGFTTVELKANFVLWPR